MNQNRISRLASLATYRQLYNDGNNDPYVIISKFIEHLIIVDSLKAFTVENMSDSLRANFGFSIPNFVVQSSINNITFVERKHNQYIVNGNQKEDITGSQITKSLAESNNSSEMLTKQLLKYCSDNSREKIDEEQLIREFSSFLLDDSVTGTYSKIISEFVIDNDDNEDILNKISQIKEGAILFSGINYTRDVSNLAWKNKIVLYVGTEILFHLAGYNGEIFKKFALDMFDLINEMNAKNGKRIINVKYFKEVADDIDNFFKTAEEIVKGNKLADVGNMAMEEIVKGCTKAFDIVNKQVKFESILKSYSIVEADSEDYYSENYFQFNIENQEISDKYELKTGGKEKYLKQLNYISILRGRDKVEQNNLNLKDSKHIFVTEVGKMLQISKDFMEDEQSSKIPLAINMYILTNRLWFDLNKGFGPESLPSSFSVLDKSRIILSDILTDKVTNQFEKVKEELKNGKLQEDDLNENILRLSNILKKPEEIQKDLLKDIQTKTNMNSFEVYKSDKKILQDKIKKLESDRDSKFTEIESEKQARIKAEQEINKKNNENERLIHQNREILKKNIQDIESRKKNADSKVNKQIIIRRRILSIIFFILFFLLLCVPTIFKMLDQVSYFLSIIPFLFFIASVYKGEKFDSFNIIKLLLDKKEKNLQNKLYLEYEIDLNELNSLKDEIA